MVSACYTQKEAPVLPFVPTQLIMSYYSGLVEQYPADGNNGVWTMALPK